jgi:ribosomal protein S18 acetylase RimI-like enzyme
MPETKIGILRLAKKRDIPSLVQIERDVYSYEDPDFGKRVKPDAWNQKDMRAAVRDGSKIYLMEEGEGDQAVVVGYLTYRQNKDYLLAQRIVVDPRFRNSGFGDMMLKFIEKERRADEVKVAVPEDVDLSLLNFLKANKYQSKILKKYVDKDRDAILFSKKF